MREMGSAAGDWWRSLRVISLLGVGIFVVGMRPGWADSDFRTVPKPKPGITGSIAQSTVRITNIQVKATELGLEIRLETAAGSLAMPTTSVAENAFIADIPNAVLALPDGETVRRDNPAPGIASVSAISLPDNRVRIAVLGVDGPPVAEITSQAEALVLNLTPAASETVMAEELELIVTATRTEEELLNVPRSVTIVTREEIEQQARLSRDLTDILEQTVPGLGPASPDGNTFSQQLRGRRVLILIDGVPVRSNLSTVQSRDFRSISPSAIERIEVVRGPSAIFGEGATGGIINIITRKASDRLTSTVEAGVDAAASDNRFLEGDSFGNYLEYGLSGTEGIADFVVNFSRRDRGAFFDAQGDRVPAESVADTETSDILGKLGLNFGEAQRLQLSVNYFFDDENSTVRSDESILDIPGQQQARAIVVPDVEFIGVPGRENQNTLVALEYSHDDLFNSQVQAQLSYRFNRRGSDAFDFRPFDEPLQQQQFDRERLGARLQIETPLFSNASLLWGADYADEYIELNTNLGDPEEFDRTGGRVFRQIDQISLPYDFRSLGFFAQLQWDISDRWLVSGGARYERFDVEVDNFLTTVPPFREIEGGELNFDDIVFNVGLVYRATAQLSLFANFAQGFSAPDFGRAFRSLPVNSVEEEIDVTQPQRVDNYELGLRGEWDNIQVTLAGFFNTSELGTRLRPTATVADILRAPERIYGIEATLDWQPSENWQLGTSLSWQEGEFDEEDNDNFLALDSNRISPFKFTAYVENQTTPSWRNRLQLLLFGDRDRAFEDGTEVFPIEGYITVDLISSLVLFGGTFYLAVENLLNEQYIPISNQFSGGFFEPENIAARGRIISIGYRINF